MKLHKFALSGSHPYLKHKTFVKLHTEIRKGNLFFYIQTWEPAPSWQQ